MKKGMAVLVMLLYMGSVLTVGLMTSYNILSWGYESGKSGAYMIIVITIMVEIFMGVRFLLPILKEKKK